MGEQSAKQAFEVLISWLRKSDLNWLADQIDEEVALGRITSGPMSSLMVRQTEQVFDVGRRRQQTTRKGEFVKRIDYTADEKFEMVLKAIRAVVIGGIKAKADLVDALRDKAGEIRVNFVPGETGEIRHSYTLTDLNDNRAAAEHVDVLLRELQTEVQRAD